MSKFKNGFRKAKIVVAEAMYSGSHFTCDVAESTFRNAKNRLEVSEGLFMMNNTGLIPDEAVQHRRRMTKQKRQKINKFFDTIKDELHKIHNLGFGEAEGAYEQEMNND